MKKFSKNLGGFCLLALIALVVLNTKSEAKAIKTEGVAYAPYFVVEGDYAFCVDSKAKHPHDGVNYTTTGDKNFSVLDDLFINLSEGRGNNQAMVFAVWAAIDNKSYEDEAEMAGCLTEYKELQKSVDSTDYKVEYTLYTTNETTKSGKTYQRLVVGKVTKIKEEPAPTPVATPEPTNTPKEEEKPTPTPVPTEEPTPKPTKVPEPSKVPTQTTEPSEEPTQTPEPIVSGGAIEPEPTSTDVPMRAVAPKDPESPSVVENSDTTIDGETIDLDTPKAEKEKTERKIPQTGVSFGIIGFILVIFGIVIFKRFGKKYEE